MRRGLGTLLVATLAVTFFVSSGSAPTSPAALTSSRSATERRATAPLPPLKEKKPLSESVCKPGQGGPCDSCAEFCPAQGLLDAVSAYFGPHYANEPGIRKHWGVPDEARAHTRFIIATVADPVHTHLSLFFDRQVDAIEEAVQADGYLFARSYVPWDPKEHAEDTDFRIRLAQEKYQAELEEYPGLMIFRQAGPDPPGLNDRRHLFVFLVTETPTGGINKSQFQQALGAIQAICDGEKACEASPTAGTLSILGPTFSGSLYSLALILRDEVRGFFSHVVIHSGTASSQATIGYFNSFTQGPANISPLDVQFRTFQESYEYALDRMVRFACDQGYSAGDVAVVSEDETAYGSVDLQPATPSKPHSSLCANTDDVLHLYFPRDIAQLRSAYQHDLQAQSATETAKPRTRSTLQLDLTDTGSDDDSVAHFSRGTTPLSQEAIMLGLVANLQKHHSIFVVLSATNPLDMLFLVRYFRAAYSEGRAVTIDTDLLLPREVDDPRLQGVMQITSYSLIPGVGDDTAAPFDLNPSPHLDRVFPSNYAAGTFNALLALLQFQDRAHHQPAPCPESPITPSPSADLPCSAYAQYGWPNLAEDPQLPDCPEPNGQPQPRRCLLAPPLWLTVLGHSGYWPVTLLDTAPRGDDLTDASTELHAIQAQAVAKPFHRRAPQHWIALCCFFVVLALIYVYLIWRGSMTSASRFAVKFAPKHDSWRNSVLFLAHLLILALLLSLFWPWVRWSSHFQHFWFGCVLFAFTAAVICVFAADMSVRGNRAWATAFLAVSLLLSAFAIWRFLSAVDPRLNFTLYRYIHVTSGVSPLVPGVLFIFAGLWWCWYNLDGLALWEQSGFQFLPALSDVMAGGEKPSRDDVDRVRLQALTIERNKDLLGSMHSTSQFRRVVFPAFVTLALAVSLIGFDHPIRTLEGSLYDRLFASLLVVALFVLLCELFGVMLIWIELRRLLTALNRLPLRRAFKRMEAHAWKSLWELGASAVQDFFPIVARQFEALSRLRNSSPDDHALVKAIEAAEAQRTEIARWVHSGALDPRPAHHKPSASHKSPPFEIRLRRATRGVDADSTIQTVAMIVGLQTRMASTCAAALKYLNSAWEQEKTPVWRDQDEFGEKDDKQIRSQLAPQTRFAEDFVCLFYLNFISSVFMRMRTLVMTVAGIFVLTLLSITSYPFEPKASFHSIVIFLFFLILAIIAFAFAQMHRDPTLSRITNTTPGELGIDFWIRIISFTAVPLLSLLASQFPSISGSLFSWLQPALQALK